MLLKTLQRLYWISGSRRNETREPNSAHSMNCCFSQTLHCPHQCLVSHKCSLFFTQEVMSSVPIAHFSLLVECPVMSANIITLPFLLQCLYRLFLNIVQIEINSHIFHSLGSMSLSSFPHSTAEPTFNTHN